MTLSTIKEGRKDHEILKTSVDRPVSINAVKYKTLIDT